MWFSSALIVLAAAGSSLATCGRYPVPHVDWNKAEFAIQVCSESRSVDGLMMKLLPGGSGDKDLYLRREDGSVPTDFFLDNGVITQISDGKTIRVVASGDYDLEDSTTKMFMTQRADPPVKFIVNVQCNEETGEFEYFLLYQAVNGEGGPKLGYICVRPGHDGRYDFRYAPGYPAGTPKNRECTGVKLRLLPTSFDLRSAQDVENNYNY